MRSVKRVAVTDIANVASIVPKDTYLEALMTSKTQVQSKDHVQSHCTANSTSDSEGNVHQTYSITLGYEVSNACCGHRYCECCVHRPKRHLFEGLSDK